MAAIRRAIREDAEGKFLSHAIKSKSNHYSGYCYVASEAFIALVRRKGYRAMHLGLSHILGWGVWNHWFVKSPKGIIIDPTMDQFRERPSYHLSIGKGFLTPIPSTKAKLLISAARKYMR